MLAAAAGLLVVLLLGGLLPVEIVRVESDSMAPTVQPGDRLLVVNDTDGLRRGRLIVLHDPLGAGALVKRVVGVGGDVVAIEDGVLVVNGAPVVEPYADPDRIDGVFHKPRSVPPGHVFVLGDDRRGSVDSRDFGPVPVSDAVGRVVWRLGPVPGSL